MERSPGVEQLAVAWLAGMKAGDAAVVAGLFAEHEATTVIGNGADQWFTGDAYTSTAGPEPGRAWRNPVRARRAGRLGRG